MLLIRSRRYCAGRVIYGHLLPLSTAQFHFRVRGYFAAIRRASPQALCSERPSDMNRSTQELQRGGTLHLGAREKRHKPHRPSGLILDDHHQGRIIATAVFPKLTDSVLGIIKCRRNIW
jgi:hypothetical protein